MWMMGCGVRTVLWTASVVCRLQCAVCRVPFAVCRLQCAVCSVPFVVPGDTVLTVPHGGLR